MPRSARLVSSHLPMHIMGRGNNRQMLFTSDKEKSYFRYLLLSKSKVNGVHIYHYCIMGSHFHLIVRLEAWGDLARFMKQVFLAYSSLYRNNHVYIGHLFQGRYKSIIIDSQVYLIKCGKYIELNPVRAKITSSPDDYAHSSYGFYAHGTYDPLVTPDPLYAGLGESACGRQASYRRLAIDAKAINSERLNRDFFLGSEEFVKRMEIEFGIQNAAAPRGRPKKPRAEPPHFIDKTP